MFAQFFILKKMKKNNKNKKNIKNIKDICFYLPALQAHPAVTRLTVYRRLYIIRGSRRRTRDLDRPKRKIGEVFLKKLNFYDISIDFLDFVQLFMVIVDTHA